MKRPVALSLAVLFTVALAGTLLAQKGASIAGTWKLDVGKSKYSTGSLPKSAIRKVEAQSDGEKTTCEEVEADGSQISYGYTVSYDDKDYPITGSGRPSWRDDLFGGAETIAIRRSGSNSYAGAFKKSSQVVMTMRPAVSKDGKVLTITQNGADAKGQPTTFVTVWDRQ